MAPNENSSPLLPMAKHLLQGPAGQTSWHESRSGGKRTAKHVFLNSSLCISRFSHSKLSAVSSPFHVDSGSDSFRLCRSKTELHTGLLDRRHGFKVLQLTMQTRHPVLKCIWARHTPTMYRAPSTDIAHDLSLVYGLKQKGFCRPSWRNSFPVTGHVPTVRSSDRLPRSASVPATCSSKTTWTPVQNSLQPALL